MNDTNNIVIEESGLKFSFPEKVSVVKFDDTAYYRNNFNKLPESKSVDFISVDEDSIAFIEVKNCTGNESDCRWRIAPENKKKNTTHTTVNVTGRDSLDIEVAQKVAMTLSALIGAKSFGNTRESSQELTPYINFISKNTFADTSKRKYVILFLEGDFGSKTRTKRMIMKDLQDSMKKKLDWLNCRVSVVDSATYNTKVFQNVTQ